MLYKNRHSVKLSGGRREGGEHAQSIIYAYMRNVKYLLKN